MQYRVVWSPYAEEQLELLLQALTEQFASEMVRAAREVDALLLESPSAFGESRYGNMRIGFLSPLGVDFEVMDDVHTVVVHDVWRIKWRR